MDIRVLILLLGSFIFYFAPAMIASYRNHKNGGAIMVVNLFFGWTFVGWVAALAWAFTSHVDDFEEYNAPRRRRAPRKRPKSFRLSIK